MDIIPDFLPLIGHLDDLLVVPLLIAAALALTPSEVVREHQGALRQDAAGGREGSPQRTEPTQAAEGHMTTVCYRTNPALTEETLNALFAEAWPDHGPFDNLAGVLSRSLGHVCAYAGPDLVGFVYVAGDRAAHAFLLDTVVRSDVRRRGIGLELVRRATELARSAGARWLHVDYEARLSPFYRKCGFRHTEAGLIDLLQ